ncbi:MAG TPA: Gfo/Idh/MocA family oxidoreductase [Kofleriaceae bacterium]|nr:Gfo/Idh/MocA family oxidoreductase [Kofleriaceae bacterium]
MNIGFLGVGEQGLQNLIPALQQIDDTRVVAVCDLSRKRAERAGARVGGARVFESISEMLDAQFDGKRLDAVIAAAYPQVHIELAEQALARSIPVFVEKPPCYDRTQLLGLIERAKQAGVATGVGLNFRFATAIQRLQDLIATPAFGGVAYIDVLHTANKPRMPLWGAASTARAVLLAQTIHAIDLAIALGGGQVAELEHRLVEETGDGILAEVSIEFATGALARVLSGNLFPDFTFFLRVVGRKGHMATINNFWELDYKAEGQSGPDGRDNKRWRNGWHPSPLDSGHARTGYVGELAGFLASVRSKERFACDFASMLPTYDVIEAICQPIEGRSSGHAARAASAPAINA